MAESLRLSFALTRLQRVVNPPERLLVVLLAICAILCGLYAVITAPGFIPNWVVLCIGLGAIWLVFRNQMRSFCLDLLTKDYINTFAVKDDYVFFGVGVGK